MNEQTKYDKTLNKLVGFIDEVGFKEIIIHQFNFLPLYFPLYMVLSDINEISQAVIKFSDPIESDSILIKKMMSKEFESFDIENGNKTLNFGLCEPVLFSRPHESEYSAYTQSMKSDGYINESKYNSDTGSFFIHLPFINIPHVYGVALKNRPLINKIKRTKRTDGNDSLSIISFWTHFAAKLNLLDKSDFKDLIVSLYPRGSSLDWLIRKHIIGFECKGITWVQSVESEFDDLFKGLVDVAFTIQPWAAISASEEHNPPLDIEIVYKHGGEEFKFSSLIFHTNKKEYLIFGDFILNCISELLKIKIEEIYKKESTDLDKDIIRYCKLGAGVCTSKDEDCCCPCCTPSICGNKDEFDSDKKGCIFETKMAVRLINDSQIYRRDLGGIKDEENEEGKKRENNKMLEEEVVADYFWEKYEKCPEYIIEHL